MNYNTQKILLIVDILSYKRQIFLTCIPVSAGLKISGRNPDWLVANWLLDWLRFIATNPDWLVLGNDGKGDNPFCRDTSDVAAVSIVLLSSEYSSSYKKQRKLSPIEFLLYFVMY